MFIRYFCLEIACIALYFKGLWTHGLPFNVKGALHDFES
jgi:hypothetical protein